MCANGLKPLMCHFQSFSGFGLIGGKLDFKYCGISSYLPFLFVSIFSERPVLILLSELVEDTAINPCTRTVCMEGCNWEPWLHKRQKGQRSRPWKVSVPCRKQSLEMMQRGMVSRAHRGLSFEEGSDLKVLMLWPAGSLTLLIVLRTRLGMQIVLLGRR